MSHPIEEGEWLYQMLIEDRESDDCPVLMFRDGRVLWNGHPSGTYSFEGASVAALFEGSAEELPEGAVGGKSTMSIPKFLDGAERIDVRVDTVFDDPDLDPFVEHGELVRKAAA